LKNITLAIDAMGGDYGPSVVVPAALTALRDHPALSLVLVGDKLRIEGALSAASASLSQRLQIHLASQVVAMDESPTQALRTKKDSSLRVAINLVKEGTVSACVSAGNTGALMATARFVLKTLPGIDRPAIMSVIPSRIDRPPVRMLDLGANLDADENILFQFAAMGSVFAATVADVPRPRVGLLNIGSEEMKGNEAIKAAAEKLSQCEGINYVGFIEGDGIFQGEADVVVCDGFVGNVALKTCEGVARLITRYIKEAFNRNLLTRILGVFAGPVLMGLKKQLNPAQYNGATLLGLKGIVVKSHGGADVLAFTRAIEEAMTQVEHDAVTHIQDDVHALLSA